MIARVEPPASALVIAAHPDDAEFGCGATVAQWAAAGSAINLLVLTSGDKGSHDPAVNPFELATRVLAVMIDGQWVFAE